MTYYFILEQDYSRLMMACIIEARMSIPEIKNQVGSVIKNYVDGKVALIEVNSLVYKIETNQSIMAGYFSIDVNTENGTALQGQFVLRPAFIKFSSDIQNQITIFINEKKWEQDTLL